MLLPGGKEAHHVLGVGGQRGGVPAAQAPEGRQHNLPRGHAPRSDSAAADERERTKEAVDGDHRVVRAKDLLA